MARPRRPEREAILVRAAAGEVTGSATARAGTLARRVARAALQDLDGAPGDRISSLLGALACAPIDVLATDVEIDTAALIRAERLRRIEARDCRRIGSAEADAEDRDILANVERVLARRYARYLAK